jgi:hypothetical protein
MAAVATGVLVDTGRVAKFSRLRSITSMFNGNISVSSLLLPEMMRKSVFAQPMGTHAFRGSRSLRVMVHVGSATLDCLKRRSWARMLEEGTLRFKQGLGFQIGPRIITMSEVFQHLAKLVSKPEVR